MSSEKDPLLKFVDDIDDNKHVMLLYDDDKYRVNVQNRFLLNGLKKGEHCICFTTGDPKQFEKELASSGVNLEPFVKQNLIHLHKIQDITQKEIGTAIQETLQQITVEVKPYFRCVGRFVEDISNEKGIQTQIEVEKIIHSIFDELQCGYVSIYGMEEIEPQKRNLWLSDLLKYHHYVIYATDPGRAVAFDTGLLELAA